ncbi:hypothetical protein PghCCS26_41950 [Paenibacillus glycanilyticus]|uniref:Uncharacterized protein n=1 Tax=Paenibacillus glycanilyticus TaxID=126569 RepID=A0ABQ6NR83_9BACL|nr:hypothetical protein [Paenibacillus glycanilyticus]GMK47065.1 hypothetical protein PghCCS26_41950 [Paenibacillus glycanilyticus]
MNSEVEILISQIKNQINPIIIANKISHFVSDAMREGKISLYEAYMLNWEEIKHRRLGYIQRAWNGRVRIATCLAILNQKLLAHIFDEQPGAEELKAWGLEAYNLNIEQRTHYILDRYHLFLDTNGSQDLLGKLLDIRNSYDRLSDDNGPYHTEVFPYHFFSPEEILLGRKSGIELKKDLDESIEQLILELNS